MDIVYIVGDGCSLCNNNELRYSLRSIDAYGKNVGRVFVAGYTPEWLSDEIIKVPFKQPYISIPYQRNLTLVSRKAANILATILHVVDNTDVNEEFLISMDDHIYIKETDFDEYPFYMKTYPLPKRGGSVYDDLLFETRKTLASQGLSTFHMCPHRNMHLNRGIIEECRDFLDIALARPLPLESLAYLNNYRYTVHKDFRPIAVVDYKLMGGNEWYKVDPHKTEVISTGDFKQGIGLDCLLNGIFGKKSKYER